MVVRRIPWKPWFASWFAFSDPTKGKALYQITSLRQLNAFNITR